MKSKLSTQVKKEFGVRASALEKRPATFNVKKAKQIEHPSLCAGGDVFDRGRGV